MSFSFLKRKEKEDFLILDIGTEAVKNLIFEKRKDEIIISSAFLEYFDSYGLFDSKNFEIEIIKKAISKTIQSLEIKRLPENTILGLPANILKGRIVSHSFKRQNPKRIIEKKEADFISKEVLKEAEKKVSEVISEESGILPKDIHFTTLKILEIKIDSYQVANLQGYSGENLVFKVLAVFLPKDYLNIIENIARFFKLRNIKILHLAEGLLKTQLAGKENSIFLDVGGKTTQIFLIKNSRLEGINEFKEGGCSFSQTLSQILGIKEEEGRELKERYSKELLSIEVKNRISEILEQPQRDWFNNLKSKIKEINPRGLLPLDFFLFGGGSLLPEISEVLENGNWQEFSFMGKIKTKIISPKDCYFSVKLKESEPLSSILNNPQYTSSFITYHAYARKNF